MEELNGNVQKKILFSIGTYSDSPRRVINKIPKPEIFTTAENVTLRNNSHTNSLPRDTSKNLFRGRPASLNITDSSRVRTLPQPRSPLKMSAQNGRSVSELVAEKPLCPPSLPACVVSNGVEINKPVYPPGQVTAGAGYNRSVSLEPEQLRNTGKVALTIAAYEGEPRTPTRLDFLPANRLSRSSSKTSSSAASTPIDQLDQVLNSPAAASQQQVSNNSGEEPIGMQLKNELVATLKRSNLKKINDSAENGKVEEDSVEQSEESEEVHVVTQESSDEAKKDDVCCLNPKTAEKRLEESKEADNACCLKPKITENTSEPKDETDDACCLKPKETEKSSEESSKEEIEPCCSLPRQTKECTEETKEESDVCCIKPKEIIEKSEELATKTVEEEEPQSSHNKNFETTAIIENVEKLKEPKTVNFEEPATTKDTHREKEAEETTEKKIELTNGNNLDQIKEVVDETTTDEIKDISSAYADEIQELNETLQTLKELSESAIEPHESNGVANGSVDNNNLKLCVKPENNEFKTAVANSEKKSSD